MKEVDTIQDVQHATEENYPNGLLNKQGGHISSIFFANNQVTQLVEVDKGTKAGGSIEVYKTKEEAEIDFIQNSSTRFKEVTIKTYTV